MKGRLVLTVAAAMVAMVLAPYQRAGATTTTPPDIVEITGIDPSGIPITCRAWSRGSSRSPDKKVNTKGGVDCTYPVQKILTYVDGHKHTGTGAPGYALPEPNFHGCEVCDSNEVPGVVDCTGYCAGSWGSHGEHYVYFVPGTIVTARNGSCSVYVNWARCNTERIFSY